MTNDTTTQKIKFEKMMCGGYFVYHRGLFITVVKTDKGDWLATAKKQDGFKFVDDIHSSHLYDHNTTRKAAVEMVIEFIDGEADLLKSFASYLEHREAKVIERREYLGIILP